MAKTKKTEQSNVFVPSIQVEGQENQVIKDLNSGALDEQTAIGMLRLPTGQYVTYVIKFVGDQITSAVVEEPTNKLIAVDALKIEFVKNFTDLD